MPDLDKHQEARDDLREMGLDVWHGSEPGYYRVSHNKDGRSVKVRAIDLPVLRDTITNLFQAEESDSS